MKRVAVNGFGRIGRAFVRLACGCRDIAVVAVNDLMDVEMGAYLLRYDSVYGKFGSDVSIVGDDLRVGKKDISWLSIKNPSELPWRSLDVDVVIEATGMFTSYEKAYAHIVAGAKHAIISAPVKDSSPENISAGTVLMGVNTKRAGECVITSNASCTTNAVGLPLSALDAAIGVESAILNTVHSYTATQQTVDGASGKGGGMRFGRSAGVNIIPSSTGAAIATTKALPALSGKFDGIALRVPTAVGSIADITFVAKKSTTVKEVNDVLRSAVSGLFSVTDDEIVSTDVVGEPFVSIADLSMTRVVNGTLVKVLCWYDNEMGYAQSLIEHARSV